MSEPDAPVPPKPKRARKKRRKARANGRPAFKPSEKDRTTVKALSAAGYTEEEIAGYIKISAPTLRKHFREELAFATMELLGGAVAGLAKAIKNGEAWAVCFVLKTRGRKLHNGEGWLERQEISGPEGGAIPVRLSSLNDNQLAQLLARLDLAATAAHPG